MGDPAVGVTLLQFLPVSSSLTLKQKGAGAGTRMWRCRATEEKKQPQQNEKGGKSKGI